MSPGEPRAEVLPYLGRVTRTSAVVNILSQTDGVQYDVTFGPAVANRANGRRPIGVRTGAGGEPIQWVLEGLSPGRMYQYRLWSRAAGEEKFAGGETYRFRSQPAESGPFAFALLSDAHIAPGQIERMEILSRISTRIAHQKPDFVVMLGDNIQTFDSHGGPMKEAAYGPMLYRLLRRSLGKLPAERPCFLVNGNWEGENGWHESQFRKWASASRQRYIPNPVADTYPQGGSDGGDYYAFAWGNLLCVVLNVSGYTTTDHAYGSKIGRRDDWTLGETQKQWLFKTLQTSREPMKVIFIHHPVGGGSPDDLNARYGRGGGRAAWVGEQAEIHQWMTEFGVQAFFYGHDHVFTEMAVDGIHYVCGGSAGAPWKFSRRETGYDRYWSSYGYTWVTVDTNELAVSFVEADGKVIHRFIIQP